MFTVAGILRPIEADTTVKDCSMARAGVAAKSGTNDEQGNFAGVQKIKK